MKKKGLIAAAVLALAGVLYVFLLLQQGKTGMIDPKNRIASFDKITVGRGCSPQSNTVILHGDGRIELPFGFVEARLTTQQIARLTTAINETGYFSVEEQSVEEMSKEPEAEPPSDAGPSIVDPLTSCYFEATDSSEPSKPHKPHARIITHMGSSFLSVTAGGRTREIKYSDGIHYKGCPAASSRVGAFESIVYGIIKELPPPSVVEIGYWDSKGCW